MQKAWLVAVNMGYGHQRTAYPLKDLAFSGKVIQANDYEGISKKDRRVWEASRSVYEFVSTFKRVPLIGNVVFSLLDVFQKIFSFYPKRDLSRPSSQLKQVYSFIKKGWGKDLIEKLKKNPLPLVFTFSVPAFMAEFFNYPGEIFCVVCDADISRSWAPLNPEESRIKYFASTRRSAERLRLYGVKPENIIFTGYPLPKELIGTESAEILKEDFKSRILNLDPKKRFFEKYKAFVEEKIGALPERSNHPLTIMFSVGGAGAQKEIGIKVVKKLVKEIKRGDIRVILSAGIKPKIKNFFRKNLKKLVLDGGVEILFEKDIDGYFRRFNEKLRKTDILWTKPSELSFYSALGLPIIVAPPVGSQEDFNKRWLEKSGFGVSQGDPNYVNQWLFDWLDQGYLAEAAFEGFIEGERLGTYNIEKIVSK